ncbi:hypothetical protein RHSIM_Rhsim09G0157800 [Rhododendron simsii]|uniref:Serine aminopeptidase S33 domain-containing protein n=1 Tax=Rhododendron simsii TaxID=118357 RepID=A0A834GEP3_RHOSS|nr:hypothetical protein RHSIM_Rhsim09G0157800 [Rhododendron simsii]
MKLFTCRFLPANHEPKALIFLCHGYAAECNTTVKGMGVRLAKQGFGVYGMEYEGHGRSSGLPGYIPSFDDLVTDCSIRSNPNCYKGRPRLKTAKQLLDVSLDLEQRLQEVSLPFLVVHGGDDKVTDPSVSKLLYESACSTDKTFKLYEGMWHGLTYGELPENIDIVYSDIVAWLDDRVAMKNSRLENEQKLENDNLLKAESSEESSIET